MPEIKKAYVTIMVDDLDRAVDFYTNVLGLVEDLRFGEDWAEMVTKGITIGLHPKKVGAPPELAAKMGWGALGAQPHNAASASSGVSAGHNQSAPPGLRAEGQVDQPNSGSSASSGASAGHNQSAPPGLRAEGQVDQPNSGSSASSGASAGHNQSAPPGLRAEGQVHSHVSIGFEVADIRKTAKELETKGVKFHFQENEVNILAFFKDLDGTNLYLTQVR